MKCDLFLGIMVGNPWTDAQVDNFGAAFMWWCVRASLDEYLRGSKVEHHLSSECVRNQQHAGAHSWSLRMQDARAHFDAHL